jgi:hypothetical protein
MLKRIADPPLSVINHLGKSKLVALKQAARI